MQDQLTIGPRLLECMFLMPSFSELYREHTTGNASDKWTSYLSAYDSIFLPFCNSPTRMLSIGVQNGGDLDIYAKYFTNGSIFVGCDINPACADLLFDDDRIHIVIGDASDITTAKEIRRISSEFDIIIDDGSHTSSDIVKSFANYFELISDGGIFICEDLHCSYWENYDGGLYYELSSISFFKDLIDIVNFESLGTDAKRRDLIDTFSSRYGISLSEDLLSSIHSIKFINSICLVERRAPKSNLLGPRIVVGNRELAAGGMRRLSGDALQAPDQSTNFWSQLNQSPRRFRVDAESKIVALEQSINELNSGRLSDVTELAALKKNVGNLIAELNQEKMSSYKEIDKLKRAQRYNSIVSSQRAAVLEKDLSALRKSLARAVHALEMSRRRPLRQLIKLVLFRVLRVLSRLAPILPRDLAGRIVRTAERLDPRRRFPVLKTTSRRTSLSAIYERAASALDIGASASEFRLPKRDRVVVFSHEATRTGAPVLSLNIIDQLSEKYDVVSVTLLGGELAESFKNRSLAHFELNRASMPHAQIEQRVMDILALLNPRYAVVNSVGSYQVMSALKKAGVPSVALVHEFPADVPVHPYFAEVIDNADRVVFSTELVLESLVRIEHMCRPLKASILSQGRSVTPHQDTPADIVAREVKMVRKTFPVLDNEIVIVGLGSVHLRKGVDIFLEVAKLVRLHNPERRYRFVWVGDGYSPTDSEYSRFLRDQVQRSGIEDMVHFLPALSSIDLIYKAADALLLASRLDPLPNVAIDMIANAKPVFCFDKTTGFAELMRAHGFEDCVAQYINPSDMARRIAQALPDKSAAHRLGAAQDSKISPLFSMKSYVEKIDALGVSAKEDGAARLRDIQTIIGSGVFQRTLYEPHPSDKPEAAVVEDYVERCNSGRFARRALPGFHPYLYAELNSLKPADDPLAHYLRAGNPPGPWACAVIRQTDPAILPQSSALRVALHIHAFYTDALVDLIALVELNANLPDLFISTGQGSKQAVEEAAHKYPGKLVAIREVPNIGRNIAPLLTEFGDELSKYDIVGHVHTKQSLHVGDRQMIEKWRHFIFGNMLGSKDIGGMIDRVLFAFSQDREISVVFPEDPHILGWTECKEVAVKLADALEMRSLPENFDFPVGSMFWMTSSLFSRFGRLGLKWSDYPSEPLPIDGTMLHALERLFGALPQAEGMKIAVTNVKGLTR